jgi:hypothetical protein
VTRTVRFCAGVLVGALVPLALAEGFLRLRPPEDLVNYLGDSAPVAGIYKSDPVLRIDYRSFEDFRRLNKAGFDKFGPLDAPAATLAFLGPSFAVGLGDAAEPAMPAYRIYRGLRDMTQQKDQFHQWIAQSRLLLANGFRPKRVFFVLIPQEVSRYSEVPLAWFWVNRNGALQHRYRVPNAALGAVLGHSRLALLGWTRSGRLSQAPYRLRTSDITERVPREVAEDFRAMFGVIGETSRRYGVPMTVILLPDRRQVLYGSNYALQVTLQRLAREAGVDIFDAAPVLNAQQDKMALYIPDWHYTALGNRLILEALAREYGLTLGTGVAKVQ